MATKMIPLIPGANQSLECTLPVDDKNITLSFRFTYNRVAEYWFMSIADASTNALLLDAVPLVTGIYPAADLLGQYQYLGIGSATIVVVDSSERGIPAFPTLGSQFYLVWTDTVA